jgi:cellulose synthase/poly-beta-1,6-N-acetylglucosamine synthase-like glycosyltransferase
MATFFLTIVILALAVDLLLIILWLFNFKSNDVEQQEQPNISILVAARNEENNLADCLDSLMALDYPMDRIEVLVGNDRSEDQTGEIAQAYATRFSSIKHYNIYRKVIEGNGKANVLAQLACKAKSEHIFITDADISVPSDWITSMLRGMNEETALVTGTSVVVGKTFLAYMQQIDWLFATGMLKVVSDLRIPVTTMGNNMLVRKSVYEEIGGYEAMPFSVTEDLELFRHIKAKYKTVNLFSPGVLNQSKPLNSFTELLIQRKRWMRGAFGLPLIMIFLLLLQASYVAFFIGLIVINPLLGWSLLGAKFLLRFIFLTLVVKKLASRVNIFGSLIFEVYAAFFSMASLAFYVFSGDIEWKGRNY